MLMPAHILYYSSGWNACMEGRPIDSVIGGVDEWLRMQADSVSYVNRLLNRYDAMSGYFGALYHSYKQRKGMLL